MDSEDRPAGWHYQRQLTLVTDPEQAQDGERYVHFTNETPGKGCRALQGFPVDGRRVAALRIGFHVRGRNIRYGQQRDQWPMLTVTFYDERRAAIATEIVGPYTGTFGWRRVDEAIRVPLRARDAIVRIGLLGAIGEIDFDGLQVLSAAE